MSKKTNIRKKPVIRDFGIQPYRKCDKDYPEVIRTPTFKAANDATVVRESEYAKPYDESEDYSGMEYPAPNWPGFNWPGMDYPDMGWPIPDFPNMYDPWHMNFRCDVSPCWCEGKQKHLRQIVLMRLLMRSSNHRKTICLLRLARILFLSRRQAE